METKKKVRKNAPAASSSSDTSSDSGSDSSSSSSSSTSHRKQKHRNIRKRRESSSSSEETVKKPRKHSTHKKSAIRKHTHAAKMRVKIAQTSSKKARSLSPASRAAHKHHLKAKLAAKKAKLAQIEEHEEHSTRTPTRRDVKKDRTPDRRLASPTRIRISVPNNRVRDRSAGRPIKDSPSSRRHIREPAGDKERAEILARCQERQRERERLRRMEDDVHVKDKYKSLSSRSGRHHQISPDRHHERSRSHSHGKVPIRERLDKDFERPPYRRSISREHDDYPVVRAGSSRENVNAAYSRDRPPQRDDAERNYDYRDERRMPGHEFGQSRSYEERPHHHRNQNWDEERPSERSGSRTYEGRDWEAPGHPKRTSDEPYKDPRDRAWNDQSHEKWSKEKDSKEWNRSWKDSPSSVHHAPSAPQMGHPRRFPGPQQQSQNEWSPRHPGIISHSSAHKMEYSSGPPPFKSRHPAPGGSAPYFGYKQRFQFKRFPSQFSKINYPSKRILPSSTATSSGSIFITKSPMKIDGESLAAAETPTKAVSLGTQELNAPSTPGKSEPLESGEIPAELDEDKVEADTTFSGNAETQSQDECEGNLSEISDVDDDILNREEVSCDLVSLSLKLVHGWKVAEHNDNVENLYKFSFFFFF